MHFNRLQHKNAIRLLFSCPVVCRQVTVNAAVNTDGNIKSTPNVNCTSRSAGCSICQHALVPVGQLSAAGSMAARAVHRQQQQRDAEH